MFVLTFTVSAAMTGLFGLYPNNPVTQQYRTVVARNVSPEFLAPVNGFLGLLNLQPIPDDQYQPGDGLVLDPGGWLLEQFGMTVPPLYGPDRAVVVLDPAGVLLELLGVDVAALPESTTPLDPAGLIFQQIGLTLPAESPNENPPDPAGTLLAFLFPDYDLESASETLLDPGGMILAWLIPNYQPPPINDSQNPPPDPGGQLLALFISPQLFNTSNNTLNPGDVILSWLFPPASESQLPSEQDIVDAAMTSIVATQPNLASLATNTPIPTLTLMPGNALTFTPTTPTGTVSSVVVNPPPVNNPGLTSTGTPTYTPVPVTYTVSYNANGATSGTAPASQTKIQGVALTLATNSGGLLLTNFIFNGWNTQTDGSGTHYVTGGTYSTDAAAILYAEWACSPSLTVTTNADSGTGSLRQAMIDVCTGGTITFAGNYVITLASQLPSVNKTMTITGNGAANTIIQANASPNVATYRVFEVASGGNLTLIGMRVQNGVAPTYGGGIYNTGTLTVSNSTISGNNAICSGPGCSSYGGGIFNTGTLVVNNSTFSNNSTAASNPANTAGGGIGTLGGVTVTITNSVFLSNSSSNAGGIWNNGSTLTVTNSTFDQNSANYWAGAIMNGSGSLTVTGVTFSNNNSSGQGGGAISNSTGATLAISNSAFNSNSGRMGGAIYDAGGTITVGVSGTGVTNFSANTAVDGGGAIYIGGGYLQIIGGTFSSNSGGIYGGGIFNSGTSYVSEVSFSNNSADSGGGIYNTGSATVAASTFSGNFTIYGGSGILNGGTATVTNSTFSGNSISNSLATHGGGIQNATGSTLTLTNSTFSGNAASNIGWGGGLINYGTATVTNNTFSGNSASGGGGIFNYMGTLSLRNTIVANSTSGGDCNNLSGTIAANINNLVGDGSCSPALSGDPMLGPLANNGYITLTMALLAGSPAIDAGDDSSCPSGDQRYTSRPYGLHCDIGAYESSFSAPTPAGHTISSFSLDGGGNAVTVTGGSSVTVDYSYQVWGDSSTCPGCNYQLVWGLENNFKYCSDWTSPSPGDSPGLTGTGSPFTITAPVPLGTYTIYSFSGQYADCAAAIAAYTSAGGTAQGTITVP